jgi:hypothetical protein
MFGKKKRQPGDPPELGSLEQKIQVCKTYIQLWQNLFQFFAESLEDKQIAPEEEKDFSRTVYMLAFENFKFVKLMGADFHQSKGVLKILDKAVSLSHIKAMPEGAFAAMQVDWHEIFIGMNKTLGVLLSRLPVEEPPKGQKAAAKPAAKNTPPPAKPSQPVAQPGQPGA